MPNGKEEKGTSWETTPGAIARGISKSLFERTVISLVDGELWDLTRPLEKSCKLELLDFENIEGMKELEQRKRHMLILSQRRRFSGTRPRTFWVRRARGALDATSATVPLPPNRQVSTTIWPTWKSGYK